MDRNKQIGKLIHISKEADKAIKIKSAKDGTNSKHYIQELVEKHAEKLNQHSKNK